MNNNFTNLLYERFVQYDIWIDLIFDLITIFIIEIYDYY